MEALSPGRYYAISVEPAVTRLRPGDKVRLQLGNRAVDLQVSEYQPDYTGPVITGQPIHVHEQPQLAPFGIGLVEAEDVSRWEGEGGATQPALEASIGTPEFHGSLHDPEPVWPEARGVPLDVYTYTPGQA